MADVRRKVTRGGGAGGTSAATQRRGRSRPGWRAVFFVVAAAAVVAGGAWAVLGSSLLVVRSVHVTGTGPLVSRAEGLAAAGIPHGLPLVRVDDGEVARRVERIRQVAAADVSKDWPDTLVISVRPRVPVFAMAQGGGYALVDSSGVNVTRATRHPAGLPLLVTGTGVSLSQPQGRKAVSVAAAVLKELPPRVGRLVRSVDVSATPEVSVRLSSGVVVIWGNAARAAEKSQELTLLMTHRHARLYDVSGRGTAVTRG